MKKFLSLVLVCVMLLGTLSAVSFAGEAQIGESTTTWDFAEGVLTVSGTGEMPDYRGVEDSRPWLDVLGSITKVVVKSGVTHVGSSSFTGASGITEVVLEEGVETVGMDAFCACGTIDKVSFPSTLTSLSQGVFFNSSIKEISYPLTYAEFKANVDVSVYNEAVDAADWGEEIATSGVLTDTMTWSFADGVLTISGTGDMPNWGANATPWVALNSQIKEVVITKGITSIGSNALSHTKISEVFIPEGVTAIGGDAFAYVSTLTTVTFPSTLETMGQGTVWASNNIKTVYYYGESKEAFEAIASQANYNTNYTAEGVTFTVLELGETEVEIKVIPYGAGMENWSNQTQVLICPQYTDGTKAAPLYGKSVVWTITFTGADGSVKTVTLKQSSQYDGGTWGILRFQPCLEEGDNRFIPLKNNAYTVEVSATVGNITYHGVSAENAYSMPVHPIVDGVVDESYEIAPVTDIELQVYPAFGGWENWVNSPNKGDAAAVTQLLVGVKPVDSAHNISGAYATDAVWTITLTWLDSGVVKTKTIELKPGTTSAGNHLVRFETVLGEGENQFIPYKGQAYTVSVSTEIDGVTYHGTSAEYAFSVPMCPYVNGVEDPTYTYVPAYPFNITLGEYHKGNDEAYASDWETWQEKETLILMFRGEVMYDSDFVEGAKVVLTINGTDYTFTLGSNPKYTFSSTNILVRIPTEGIFTPVEGTKYTVSAKFYSADDKLLYVSEEIDTITYGEVLKAKNGFYEEDGKLYFYENDKKVTYWFEYDGKTYYASGATNVVINYNKKIQGKYYVWNDETGLEIADGFVTDENGTKCYENGINVIGWRHEDGSGPKVVGGISEQYSSNPEGLYYFLSTTGYMVTESTYKLGGYIREFNADHTVKPMNGLQTNAGELYYYVDGVKQTGWQTIDGVTYYFRASDAVYGRAATKWMYIGNKVYYFYASTSATPYALKDSGAIGGITYTYHEDGYIVYNGFVNCDYANEANSNTAANIQKKNGTTRYYVDGEMQTGWQQIDGNWYYFYAIGSSMGSGYMCVESRTIGGVYYEFTAEGVCLNK